MATKIIDGKSIAAEFRQQIAEETAAFKQQSGVTPHIAAILTGDDPASAVYVRSKRRACEEVGIESTLHQLPANAQQSELLTLVDNLNSDNKVHGILCQLPLPEHMSEEEVLDRIIPQKDVDAFHPENVGLIVQGRPRFLPCTPYGIQQLLVTSDIPIQGRHVVIIGRSEIVGKPMALLLIQKGEAANATVTICHSRTERLEQILQSADIIIAAIGKPKFVTASMVKPGAVIIDVGVNRVDGKLVGDVDFETVVDKASAITPVPGGVGPMTIAMLLKNTLKAAQLQSDY